MSTTWNTKYGPRRVRHDPPTLEEAIAAARGLTDDIEQQIDIAAGLMEVSADEVRAALKKSPPPRRPAATVAFTSRGGRSVRSWWNARPAPRVAGPRRDGPLVGLSSAELPHGASAAAVVFSDHGKPGGDLPCPSSKIRLTG